MKKLFTYLKNTFFYRTRIYIINEDKETVLQRLNQLYTKEYGYFIDKGDSSLTTDTFKFRPTGMMWSSPLFFEAKNSYLNGSILSEGPGKTKIVIKTRPNFYCFLAFVVFLVFGIIYCIQFFFTNNIAFLLWGLGFLFIGIPISIGIARIFALSFLEKFEIFMKIEAEINQ